MYDTIHNSQNDTRTTFILEICRSLSGSLQKHAAETSGPGGGRPGLTAWPGCGYRPASSPTAPGNEGQHTKPTPLPTYRVQHKGKNPFSDCLNVVHKKGKERRDTVQPPPTPTWDGAESSQARRPPWPPPPPPPHDRHS